MPKNWPEEVYSPQMGRYVSVHPTKKNMKDEKALGPFFTGMTADHALQVIKRSVRDKVRDPEVEFKDGKTEIDLIRWFLTDCTLVLKRVRVPGPYIVVDIEEKWDGSEQQPQQS